MAYNKSGMLQAVLARFTRIDITGKPIVGPKNCFWTDSLISMQHTMAYVKQDDITITNGSGKVCMTYSPPQTALRLDIANINFCYPDPEAIEFLAGGAIFNGAGAAADQALGYAFPAIGTDPKPFGVAMELWSSQVQNGAIVGYFHWLMPRVFLQFTKNQDLDGKNAYDTGLDGIAVENPMFGTGPKDDIDWPLTSRIGQWMQEPGLPDYTYGYDAVVAQS